MTKKLRSLTRQDLPDRPDRVLVLGSGPLQIGQAGEFDYSGSQAIKALQEEGVYTVLINSNIATIQTSEGFADAVYFLPVEPHFVEEVIIKERIDAILLSFGGQTALNCGLALDEAGILARHGVRVLGTPVDVIQATEDRQLFIDKLNEIDVTVARSRAVTTPADALAAVAEIGLPVMLRAAFSLGGKGSAIVRETADIQPAIDRAFAGSAQILVEECLSGWKEIEYEVVRDRDDNCITVCNMENLDPMGIHTGESIVVAPSQTLNDEEYQLLRDVALKTIRHLGIVGECNIQYALDPYSTGYRVIEVNARLSRSSALASKATGYPLAYVAAKLSLGYTLPQLANAITRSTSAFFEPAMDYIVCKIPRWDFEKFPEVDPRLGPEMKSVGEVMAIGRSFAEAVQKALRMLEIGVTGLDPQAYAFADLERELAQPTPRRLFAVAQAFAAGMSIDAVAALTRIDRFFLNEIARITRIGAQLADLPDGLAGLDHPSLLTAKRAGFSDKAIAAHVQATEADVRGLRHRLNVRPKLAQIDTLAAEYPAETNYLYLTYAAQSHDIAPSIQRKLLVLGSGCYRIGSSVEFDWCSVTAVTAARELGYETMLLNCNPETVSTDYDICDRLVFDEISLETVLELYEQEHPEGVLVSMGGQTPNNLALKLHQANVRILGTSADSIDSAEDRGKFSALCDRLGIAQPRWTAATALTDSESLVAELGGFPVVVRPSYVLSGAAMRVAHTAEELTDYLEKATTVSPEHPVVISKFAQQAREIEFDAVAERGEVVLWAVSEHIENAGVHSGDATLVLPPRGLPLGVVQDVQRIGGQLARALNITGPFNVQMLARHDDVQVIECNVRASRSFPFVSKVIGTNFIREATRLILGAPRSRRVSPDPLTLPHVGVKAPMFSFRRLAGVDPVLGVEMASTGEVACFGADADEALLKAMLATGFRIPRRGVLLCLGPAHNYYRFTEEARTLLRLGVTLYALAETAAVLEAERIPFQRLTGTEADDAGAQVLALMRAGTIDLVINVPWKYDERKHEGFLIRRGAVDLEVPLITDLWLARRVVRALGRYTLESLPVEPWSHYVSPVSEPVRNTNGQSVRKEKTCQTSFGAAGLLRT